MANQSGLLTSFLKSLLTLGLEGKARKPSRAVRYSLKQKTRRSMNFGALEVLTSLTSVFQDVSIIAAFLCLSTSNLLFSKILG